MKREHLKEKKMLQISGSIVEKKMCTNISDRIRGEINRKTIILFMYEKKYITQRCWKYLFLVLCVFQRHTGLIQLS